MPSVRNLFVRIRPRPYVRPTTDRPLTVRRDHVEPPPHPAPRPVPEPRAHDHVAAAVSPPKPDEGPRPTPAPPTRPERSQPVGPVWPSPRTWLTAELTEVDRAREDQVLERLAQLTHDLDSPLAAAQHEFAPHLRKDRQ